MDHASETGLRAAIEKVAVAYCEAIHHARPEVFETMCHPNFHMTAMGAGGKPLFWDKPAYLKRVGGRDPFPGEPSYGIQSIDILGGEIAHVKLWVDVPPRRFEDYLGFALLDGEWRLMNKLFRTTEGPPLE